MSRAPSSRRPPRTRTARLLIGLAFLAALLVIVAPVAMIFKQGLSKGLGPWWQAITAAETGHALFLSLLCIVVAVPLGAAYGLAAAWAVTKFRWRGRKWLIALIEVPFSISPIVAGVACLMVYGASGFIGGWFADRDLQIMFAVPGILIAVLFVTSPYVAREVMPLMQMQGTDQEDAAHTLGAGGFRIFWSVTLPNVKWAVLHGLILCAARALGEFGSVSVVSGHVRGQTNTLPLYIDLLYHDYDNAPAFAVASLLTLLALVALVLKFFAEDRAQAPRKAGH